MKNVFVFFAVLGLLAGGARAGVILDSSNPAGSPLTMSAGATSGLMSVGVISDNPPNDVMAAWELDLVIVPNGGATGTLTFQDPASGTAANPSNYIFGTDGLGILTSNAGTSLSANDIFNPGVGPGAVVPGSPGANLLQMDFLASSGASGLFGIYAVEGVGSSWTDTSFTTQFFTNVPSGSSMVLIGDVLVTSASVSSSVPEIPASSGLGSGILVLAGTLMLLSSRRRIPLPTI